MEEHGLVKCVEDEWVHSRALQASLIPLWNSRKSFFQLKKEKHEGMMSKWPMGTLVRKGDNIY